MALLSGTPCVRNYNLSVVSISILAPTRGASGHWHWGRAFRYFNTSPYTRGFRLVAEAFIPNPISILAPTRGASWRVMLSDIFKHFNTSPYTRGFLRHGYKLSVYHADFNTSPYTRGFRSFLALAVHANISILAPTRGASFTRLFTLYINQISILAPTRGASSLHI